MYCIFRTAIENINLCQILEYRIKEYSVMKCIRGGGVGYRKSCTKNEEQLFTVMTIKTIDYGRVLALNHF